MSEWLHHTSPLDLTSPARNIQAIRHKLSVTACVRRIKRPKLAPRNTPFMEAGIDFLHGNLDISWWLPRKRYIFELESFSQKPDTGPANAYTELGTHISGCLEELGHHTLGFADVLRQLMVWLSVVKGLWNAHSRATVNYYTALSHSCLLCLMRCLVCFWSIHIDKARKTNICNFCQKRILKIGAKTAKTLSFSQEGIKCLEFGVSLQRTRVTLVWHEWPDGWNARPFCHRRLRQGPRAQGTAWPKSSRPRRRKFCHIHGSCSINKWHLINIKYNLV